MFADVTAAGQAAQRAHLPLQPSAQPYQRVCWLNVAAPVTPQCSCNSILTQMHASHRKCVSGTFVSDFARLLQCSIRCTACKQCTARKQCTALASTLCGL